LAEGIVDLDPLDPRNRADHQQHQNDARQNRRLYGNQAQPLQPEGNAAGGPLLDLLDMDLAVAVFFEHAVSSPHIRSICTVKFEGANEACERPILKALAFENIQQNYRDRCIGLKAVSQARALGQNRHFPVLPATREFTSA